MNVVAATPPAALRRAPRRSLWRRARRLRNLTVGGTIVTVFILVAVLAPWIAPHNPVRGDLNDYLRPPGGRYLFGTDTFGRDVLSRILHGARISLGVGIAVQASALTIGVALGLLSGFYGRWVDNLIMRLAEIIFAFPGLLFAIAVMAVIGPSLYNVFIALGLVSWTSLARVVRGAVLAVKEQEFVEAARALGASNRRIIVRHLLPNIVAPAIILVTLGIGGAILAEASLSFLGLGAQPPTPSWGSMLTVGRDYLTEAPWLSIYPGLAIFLTVMGFNLLGDGLRDLLDPRMRI
ncbi:MAG: ABC transporter permease [Armatimonadota bacterium]|nr:ABC transporter permease [Armatimonadota bacterium]MDR7450739.1 ABC transporter permease [Armatimonadota bacterium]MDR7466095.1 ABC transporter permease [Armatimonadota bacterium]MDR7493868.1 ABC transporter permease [Armatimonadota bacterium]MDR7498971.1 ABC transporter permease [Armatimonadota bacterium]